MANPGTGDLISVKLIVNGKSIGDIYDLTEVKVLKAVNQIAMAHITLMDGGAIKKGLTVSSSDQFIPGTAIEVQAGFGLKTERIFQGIITAQNLRILNGQGRVLQLECRDQAIRMAIGAKNRVFTNATDSDALSNIIADNGLLADVSSTSNSFPQLVQYYSTDWDFTMARAEANGMVVLNMDNKVTIKAPTVSGDPLGEATYGENILEVDLKLDASTQLGQVEAQAWDYKTQSTVQFSASEPRVPDTGNLAGRTLAQVTAPSTFQLQSTTPLATEELKTWADANLLTSRLAKVRGEIKLFGQANLVPDQMVKLVGLGPRFDGNAYVSAVEHHISEGNWWSTISIGLDPTWLAQTDHINAPPSSALLPGIHGMQNAVVKQINQDPAGETRIQVEMPMLQSADNDGLIWARWLQSYATSGAGLFFPPEIGDEVALGFLNEDPRYPVILGSLYSSQNASPYELAEGNSIKAIVTKNQLKVKFDDKKKVITISTPGGNTITLTDEDEGINIVDQNANKIAMSSSGISMQSPSDIEIRADGEVSISGTGGVSMSTEAEASISAGASLSISGLEVDISAETALSASGGAAASISAEGELSLAAAMIMIN